MEEARFNLVRIKFERGCNKFSVLLVVMGRNEVLDVVFGLLEEQCSGSDTPCFQHNERECKSVHTSMYTITALSLA